MNSAAAIVVLITVASREEAGRLSQMLVEEKLAACVQILPEMESVYRWQDKVETQKEILLIAKTTAVNYANLEARVRSVHSYETPEIVALPISVGLAPYLEWLRANVEADE